MTLLAISFLITFVPLRSVRGEATQLSILKELLTLLPRPIDKVESSEEWQQIYGQASLVEGEWHYYSIQGINYPLAIKVRQKKIIGGNFKPLSPYKVVIPYSQFQKTIANWKRVDPKDPHDFGRYVDYLSPDNSLSIRFKMKGSEGMVESFSWGEK